MSEKPSKAAIAAANLSQCMTPAATARIIQSAIDTALSEQAKGDNLDVIDELERQCSEQAATIAELDRQVTLNRENWRMSSEEKDGIIAKQAATIERLAAASLYPWNDEPRNINIIQSASDSATAPLEAEIADYKREIGNWRIEVDRLSSALGAAKESLDLLRPELTAANECIAELERWRAYAESHGLHIGVCKSSDCPEGRLAHEYREGSTLARMFDEWSNSIGWERQLSEKFETIAGLQSALAAKEQSIDIASARITEQAAYTKRCEAANKSQAETIAQLNKQLSESKLMEQRWFDDYTKIAAKSAEQAATIERLGNALRELIDAVNYEGCPRQETVDNAESALRAQLAGKGSR